METLPYPAMSNRAADYARTVHHVDAPNGVTVADVLRPAFWKNHAERVRVKDRIEILAVDGSFDVEVRVIGKEGPEKNPTGLVVNMLRLWTKDSPAVVLPQVAEPRDFDGFKIDHTPRTRWRIVRRSDGAVVARDIQSRPEAEQWVIDHPEAESVAA